MAPESPHPIRVVRKLAGGWGEPVTFATVCLDRDSEPLSVTKNESFLRRTNLFTFDIKGLGIECRAHTPSIVARLRGDTWRAMVYIDGACELKVTRRKSSYEFRPVGMAEADPLFTITRRRRIINSDGTEISLTVDRNCEVLELKNGNFCGNLVWTATAAVFANIFWYRPG